MINFNATKEEFEMISKLADISVSLGVIHGFEYQKMDAIMDLEAVHCNDVPLDLERMVKASREELGHDLIGIRRHINRTTGKLEDCFLPRFAKHEASI